MIGINAFLGVPFLPLPANLVPHPLQINISKSYTFIASLLDSLQQAGLPPMMYESIGWREDGYTQLDKTLTAASIEEGYTQILANGFQESAIQTVQLPQSLTEIDKQAFSGCANLLQLTIPLNVTIVGDQICQNCPLLNTVSIENPDIFIKPYGTNMFTQPASANGLKQIIAQGTETMELTQAFGIDKAVTTITWK
jgi:hypothetical protein